MDLRPFIIPLVLLMSLETKADTYQYPGDKRPELSLKQACGISESLIGKLGHGEGYYVYHVGILGDKAQTGAGAWTLLFRNDKGGHIQITLSFPEDQCYVLHTPIDGRFPEGFYTRDGRITKKWLDSQEKLRKQEEAHEKAFGPAKPAEGSAKIQGDD